MILHFHDFILSKHPWAYCHLNEVPENIIYLDQTSHQNHLYPKKDEQGQDVRRADNQIACPIFEKSIQILNNPHCSEFKPDLEPVELNLSFKVPQFLSEIYIYRQRRKNPKSFND